MKVIANIHSLKKEAEKKLSANGASAEQLIAYKYPEAKAEVEIVSNKGNNEYVVKYNNKLCTAIFNPFACMYYVDDIYGVIGNCTD